MILSGVSRLKHLAGRQRNCTSCLKVSDDVKIKVIEMLKAGIAKKEAKQANFQALADGVHIGEDKYQ